MKKISSLDQLHQLAALFLAQRRQTKRNAERRSKEATRAKEVYTAYLGL
jgi:hypothetical protein